MLSEVNVTVDHLWISAGSFPQKVRREGRIEAKVSPTPHSVMTQQSVLSKLCEIIYLSTEYVAQHSRHRTIGL